MHMTKKKIVSAALAFALVLLTLAGCSAENPNPTVLKVGDENIGITTYYNLYSTYKTYYSYYGIYNVSTADDLRTFQDTIFDMLINSYLPAYQAKLAGVALTDEEEADVQTSLESQLEKDLGSYADSVDASITDEAAIKEAELKLFKADLSSNGWTYSKYVAYIEKDLRLQALSTKLLNSIYEAEVSVSDDDVKEYYDTELAKEQTAYATTPADYFTDYSTYLSSGGVQPLVAPEGYRFCKHILITFAADGEDKDVDAIVAEVQAKLDAGEDFDSLVAEYGDDPGMQSEPYMSNGYLVSLDVSDKYYDGFAEAAMALENIGDVSAPVETTSGYHFIQYTSDVSTDPVAFDTVSDAIKTKLQSDGEKTVYDAHMAEWKESTDIVKYYDRVSNIK